MSEEKPPVKRNQLFSANKVETINYQRDVAKKTLDCADNDVAIRSSKSGIKKKSLIKLYASPLKQSFNMKNSYKARILAKDRNESEAHFEQISNCLEESNVWTID